jgi:preprotein translocase subunit SecF
MQTKIRTFLKETHIDFMSKDKLALSMSLVVLLICVASLLIQGLNLGLDFTGGTIIEAAYPAPVEIPAVREALTKAGFGDAQTQYFGTSSEVLMRIPPRTGLSSGDISGQVLDALKQVAGGAQAQIKRVEFVGPQVGNELFENGGLAMLFALIGILIYITLRFELKLALGTIAATVHDIVFTVGVFSVFQIEVDLTVLAAVLAVTGYSVNDTVVVLDRIRENFRKMRRESTREVMNASINQTLTRTIITSFVTFLAVTVLLIFGGPVLRGFSIAMLIGIAVGTYSSIYIASAGALQLGVRREDLLPKAREAVDNRP